MQISFKFRLKSGFCVIAMDVWSIVASKHAPRLPTHDTAVLQLLEWDATARRFLRLRTTSWTAHAAVQPFVALDEWSTLFRCLSAELCDINCAYDEWYSGWGYYSK